MKRLGMLTVLSAVLLLSLGCAAGNKCQCPRSQDAASYEHIREGYALLYALASQEKNVDALLKVKKTSSQNREIIQEIAQVNRDILQSLAAWERNDPHKTVSGGDLPDLQARSLDRINKRVTWQLLLSGRRESIKTLLLTQYQSLIYEACLLKAIHESESDQERKQQTERYAARLDRLADQVACRIRLEE